MSAAAPVGLAAVVDPVRSILRLEGLAVFAAAIAAYFHFGFAWWLFVLLALAPDLSFFAYLAGPRRGAWAYNAAHSDVGVILIGIAGHAIDNNILSAVALVWAAHIGFDRMLGYGLKYPTAFGDTHLGHIGRA